MKCTVIGPLPWRWRRSRARWRRARRAGGRCGRPTTMRRGLGNRRQALGLEHELGRREDLARDAIEIHHRAGDQLDRQAARDLREGRLGRLLRFGGDRLQAFGRQLEHAERQAHDASRSRRPMCRADSPRPPRSWLPRPPLHDRRGRRARRRHRRCRPCPPWTLRAAPARRHGAGSTRSGAPPTGCDTALATRRPPGFSAVHAASNRPGLDSPPPMNTASGDGSPANASGARSCTICRSGVPSAAALRAARAARSGSASMPIALSEGWRSSHSMAIEPAPRPTSHRSSPWRGASADTVTARTSRLVSWPSCSNSASSRPGVNGRTVASARGRDLQRDGVERRDRRARSKPAAVVRAHALARTAHGFQHGELASCPCRARPGTSPSLAGVSPSHDSARMRAPGCRWRTMPSSARPCRLTSATSCSDQPSRAAARLKADALRQAKRLVRRERSAAAGRRRRSGKDRRSPARRPAGRDASRSRAGRRRSGSARRAAAADQRVGQAEMALAADHQLGRRPPACCATGDRPSTPSSPMPTMDSQRAAVQLAALMSHARSHSRRHHGSLGAGPSCSPAIRASRRPCRSPAAPPRPRPQPIATRIGGFGGADGLARFLREQAIEAVIDATHPYADQISANAVAACARDRRAAGLAGARPRGSLKPATAGRPCRPPTPRPGARRDAATRVPEPRPAGAARLRAAPQHHYIARLIEPPRAGGPAARPRSAAGSADRSIATPSCAC